MSLADTGSLNPESINEDILFHALITFGDGCKPRLALEYGEDDVDRACEDRWECIAGSEAGIHHLSTF